MQFTGPVSPAAIVSAITELLNDEDADEVNGKAESYITGTS
jgi:hypothetical protein